MISKCEGRKGLLLIVVQYYFTKEGVTPYSSTILLHDKQMGREEGVTPYSSTVLLHDKQMGREEGVTPYSITIWMKNEISKYFLTCLIFFYCMFEYVLNL